jgi:CheY-like chemotaxis protein
MVVDDDPSVLLLIDVMAERLGFKVRAATSGLQALEQLRDGLRPDLILLDLMMERIDGVTFLNHLKDMPSVAGTRVVAMSTQAVLDHYAPQLQVDGTLIKPISRQSLAACLEQYMRQPD